MKSFSKNLVVCIAWLVTAIPSREHLKEDIDILWLFIICLSWFSLGFVRGYTEVDTNE